MDKFEIKLKYHDKQRGIALVESTPELIVDEDYLVADEHGLINFNYKWRCVSNVKGLYRLISYSVDNQHIDEYMASLKQLLNRYND